MVGMCRQLLDMDSAVSYVKENIADGKPIFTVGHSWGGYAAAAVMEKHTDIAAAALIAPMYSGATVMIEQSRRRKDPRADLMEDIFREYQRYLFGEITECNAVRGINASGARVLVAQGICDDTLAHDCEALTAHLSEIRKEGVEVMWCTGSQGTHRGIWHSDAAEEYGRKLRDGKKLAEYLSGAQLEGDALIAYYVNVDHRLLSEVNGELVKRIFATFESALNGGSKGGVL
jgi:acetyl esterase/lipase